MEGAEAKYAAECAFAAPVAGWGEGKGARDVIFVVIDQKAKRAVEVVFHKFAQSGFAPHKAFGTADYVVAVGEETCVVGR